MRLAAHGAGRPPAHRTSSRRCRAISPAPAAAIREHGRSAGTGVLRHGVWVVWATRVVASGEAVVNLNEDRVELSGALRRPLKEGASVAAPDGATCSSANGCGEEHSIINVVGDDIRGTSSDTYVNGRKRGPIKHGAASPSAERLSVPRLLGNARTTARARHRGGR